MFDCIYNICEWWYSKPEWKQIPNGLHVMCWVSLALYFVVIMVGSWKGKESITKEWDTIFNFISICAVISVLAGVALFMFFPLLFLLFPLGVAWLVSYMFSSWGDKYRELEKKSETKQLEALQELIKTNEDFKAIYEDIMKNTPKI